MRIRDREVFGDTLNESRDPDRGTTDRYSARFYLKNSSVPSTLSTSSRYTHRFALQKPPGFRLTIVT